LNEDGVGWRIAGSGQRVDVPAIIIEKHGQHTSPNYCCCGTHRSNQLHSATIRRRSIRVHVAMVTRAPSE
jgi:hypothetical protein